MSVKRSEVASGNYSYRTLPGGSWNDVSWGVSNIWTKKIDSSHPGWRHQPDGGGPFHMTKIIQECAPGTIAPNPYSRGQAYVGSLSNMPARNGFYTVYDGYDTNTLKSKGTTAIARCLPTNPAAQMSTALGELANDGLPHVIGSTAFKEQVRTARKAGDEYLNYQFGWLPLVSDLRKFAHAVKHRDDIMSGYVKYSRKQIRRRFAFPADEGSRSGQVGHALFALSNGHSCLADYTDTYRREVWFSGAFKYYVPSYDEDKFGYYRSQAVKILGLELTPEVVWNLAPWSWAIDWFTNTGDVLHNISRLGKDGLVMRYGYVMSRYLSSREVRARGTGTYTQGFGSHYKVTNVNMTRMPATPYGFGLTFNGLSNTQKAIIAALGLTRAF